MVRSVSSRNPSCSAPRRAAIARTSAVGDQAENDPTRTPLHVAQGDQNHGAPLGDRCGRGDGCTSGTTTTIVRIDEIGRHWRTSTRPTIATKPMTQPARRGRDHTLARRVGQGAHHQRGESRPAGERKQHGREQETEGERADAGRGRGQADEVGVVATVGHEVRQADQRRGDVGQRTGGDRRSLRGEAAGADVGATTATTGAMPNVIASARQSSGAPSAVPPHRRAAAPSSTSSSVPASSNSAATA